VSCHKNTTEPNDGDTKEKILSYNVNQLPNELIGFDVIMSNIIYPDSTEKYWYVPDEIVVSINEQYKVELTNCSINQVWSCKIEDASMKLIHCDTLLNDSVMNLIYSFGASDACKGCLLFYNNIMNQQACIVEYTCSPVSSIELNLIHQDWLIDTTVHSSLNLYLSGQTNVSKLKVEYYGDGLTGAVSIYPKNDGSFSDTINIALSHVSGVVLKDNARIALYGTTGFPRIVTILNPNNH
jgi:hypothetical protein